MSKSSEFAAAIGFVDDREGDETETVDQTGNAVPANVAAALHRQVLVGIRPTIDSFADGVEGDVPCDG